MFERIAIGFPVYVHGVEKVVSLKELSFNDRIKCHNLLSFLVAAILISLL